jgi:hypothetical protein
MWTGSVGLSRDQAGEDHLEVVFAENLAPVRHPFGGRPWVTTSWNTDSIALP